MFEVELKAHVKDLDALKQRLVSFALFKGYVEKEDTYYSLNGVTVRIRKERLCPPSAIKDGTPNLFSTSSLPPSSSPDNFPQNLPPVEDEKLTYYFTYKKKEVITDTEFNDEKECILTDYLPIKEALLDSGFTVSLKKHKSVLLYCVSSIYGNVSIEVCNVEKLGNFVEVEVLTRSKDKAVIEKIQKLLHDILHKMGLTDADIEPRYYRDLLKELN